MKFGWKRSGRNQAPGAGSTLWWGRLYLTQSSSLIWSGWSFAAFTSTSVSGAGGCAGVGVVGGDQDQRPLRSDHLEGELDQVVVDAAVAIGVDQDQLRKLVLVAEVARDPDALLEAAAALGVDVEAHPRQVGDRQQHRRVADRDRRGPVVGAVGIALGLARCGRGRSRMRARPRPALTAPCQSAASATSTTGSHKNRCRTNVPALILTRVASGLEVLRVGALDLRVALVAVGRSR